MEKIFCRIPTNQIDIDNPIKICPVPGDTSLVTSVELQLDEQSHHFTAIQCDTGSKLQNKIDVNWLLKPYPRPLQHTIIVSIVYCGARGQLGIC